MPVVPVAISGAGRDHADEARSRSTPGTIRVARRRAGRSRRLPRQGRAARRGAPAHRSSCTARLGGARRRAQAGGGTRPAAARDAPASRVGPASSPFRLVRAARAGATLPRHEGAARPDPARRRAPREGARARPRAGARAGGYRASDAGYRSHAVLQAARGGRRDVGAALHRRPLWAACPSSGADERARRARRSSSPEPMRSAPRSSSRTSRTGCGRDVVVTLDGGWRYEQQTVRPAGELVVPLTSRFEKDGATAPADLAPRTLTIECERGRASPCRSPARGDEAPRPLRPARSRPRPRRAARGPPIVLGRLVGPLAQAPPPGLPRAAPALQHLDRRRASTAAVPRPRRGRRRAAPAPREARASAAAASASAARSRAAKRAARPQRRRPPRPGGRSSLRRRARPGARRAPPAASSRRAPARSLRGAAPPRGPPRAASASRTRSARSARERPAPSRDQLLEPREGRPRTAPPRRRPCPRKPRCAGAARAPRPPRVRAAPVGAERDEVAHAARARRAARAAAPRPRGAPGRSRPASRGRGSAARRRPGSGRRPPGARSSTTWPSRIPRTSSAMGSSRSPPATSTV